MHSPGTGILKNKIVNINNLYYHEVTPASQPACPLFYRCW